MGRSKEDLKKSLTEKDRISDAANFAYQFYNSFF